MRLMRCCEGTGCAGAGSSEWEQAVSSPAIRNVTPLMFTHHCRFPQSPQWVVSGHPLVDSFGLTNHFPTSYLICSILPDGVVILSVPS